MGRALPRLAVLGVLLTTTSSLSFGEAYVRSAGPLYTIGNAFISRTLTTRGGVLRTASLRDERTGWTLDIESQEFLLRFADQQLTTNDFRLSAVTRPPVDGGERLSFTLRSESGLEVEVVYEIIGCHPYMRKVLLVRAAREPGPPFDGAQDGLRPSAGDPERAEGPLLRDVQVERFRVHALTDLGGLGQPVFIAGRFFAGIEYPAADNTQRDGLVTLEHHPGRHVGPEG